MADHDNAPPDIVRKEERDEPAYQDTDISELPDWWRSAIAEFRSHDLPPYKPPRFSDGVLIQEVIDKLKEEHSRRISLIGIDTRYGDDWSVRVDDKTVGEIEHTRAAEGYVVFGMESEKFEQWIDDEIQEIDD